MKIFFMKPKSKRKAIAGKLTCVILVMLISMITFSQIKILFGTQAIPASTDLSESTDGILTLESDCELNDGKVSILKDGETYSVFSGNTATVNISGTNVIEIYSESDKVFNVKMYCGDGVEIVGKSNGVECRRGLNYIGRCIYLDAIQ